ncbi:MAG TPA: peptidase S1 [Brevundimonas sp.]|uniref:peptidase S1 n=1 Tax=Brevundimonas sp. TaxID=1871086 RepID=UPI002623B909|nr:peptidase S1 [Brevundimonas sp.]HRO31878.1 peptidase S1 [Brevundimonas sp.]
MMIRSICLAAALTLAAAPALAQDVSASPTFGNVRLSSGFPNDPHTTTVIAGGSVNAANLPGACVGQIGEAPDVRLTYSGGSMPLFIRTVAAADTTLVINGPDGRWYCDDDSHGDGDAQVRFSRPQSGVYDIWIGAFSGNPEATLVITEIE